MPLQTIETNPANKTRWQFNLSKLVLPLLLAATFALNNVVAHAADTSNINNTKPQTKSRGRPFQGMLKLVDVSQNFIVLEGRSAQKFFISPQTTIKIDGIVGKLSSIEAGKYVGGYAREESEGRWVATTLNVYSDRAKTNSTSKK